MSTMDVASVVHLMIGVLMFATVFTLDFVDFGGILTCSGTRQYGEILILSVSFGEK